MGLLQEAVPEVAFLKAGILGFGGSGKTRTATEIAIGLALEAGGGKPVAFFDTETGSDYVLGIFAERGVRMVRVKSRSFRDLLTFMKEAEGECSVAIVDSISHVWTELQNAYKKRKNLKRLEFQDWGPLKSEWQQFTDAYLNSRLHVVLCGRAAFEYDFEENERGKKELIKTGVKMRAESEMGYEPSLLLEMERVPTDNLHGMLHRCHVMKDRFDVMDGTSFDNPTYESFRPFIARLNLGGEHRGIDTSRTSEAMFDGPDYSATERRRHVEILGEKIKEALVLADLDGSSAATKKRRAEVLIEAFGTSSWTQITEKTHPGALAAGYAELRTILGLDGKPEPDPHGDPEPPMPDDPGPSETPPEPPAA